MRKKEKEYIHARDFLILFFSNAIGMVIGMLMGYILITTFCGGFIIGMLILEK